MKHDPQAGGIRHASHGDIVKRLRRAEGHLRAVVGMIEAGRPCLELAQQLHAIERAIGNAKRELIQDHIDHCLDRAIEEGQAEAALAEFRALTKFL
ncbi:MAG: metal-sensing transcriptional repressor [Acetobacteraceae bacterium]|nr:metal-sensing transcriptional repressor [Acetobacteraceae bacterium]